MRASEQIIMVGGSDALGGAGIPAGYALKLDGSGAPVLDGSGNQIIVRIS